MPHGRVGCPPPARGGVPPAHRAWQQPLSGLRTASLPLSTKPSCSRSVCGGPRRCEDIKWRPLSAAPGAGPHERRLAHPRFPGPASLALQSQGLALPGALRAAGTAGSSACTDMLLAVCSFCMRNGICGCSADASNTVRVRWWGFWFLRLFF